MKATPEQTMYPHEVQIAIFKQLLTYEILLKPGIYFHIHRHKNGKMFALPEGKISEEIDAVPLFVLDEENYHDSISIDLALQEYWEEIPSALKIQN